MKEYQNLSHGRWGCKCHVMSILKRCKDVDLRRIKQALRIRINVITKELLKNNYNKFVVGDTLSS